MALDGAELIVANSGHGYIAPFGTALPTIENSSPAAAFAELGYFSENGVTITIGRTTSEVRAWQSRSPLRRTIASEIVSFAAELEQWNGDTVELALGGGAWTEPTANHYKFVPPTAAEGITAWAFILDFEDENGTVRFTSPKVELEGDVTIALSRDNAALLPITLTVLDTGSSDLYNIYTDLPQFEGAS